MIYFCVKLCFPVKVDAFLFLDTLLSEEPFKINRWKLPVTKPKIDMIAKGCYTKYVEVRIDPTWPSSSTHRQGFVKYAITVCCKLDGRMNAIVTHTEEQEIWVLNSVTVPTDQPPMVVSGVAKQGSLPVLASIPSEVVVMGQMIPVTVQLSPYLVVSKYAGQEAVVLGATFKVKQKHVVHCRSFDVGESITNNGPDLASEGVAVYDDCLNFALTEGWPQSMNGWERTVDIRIPSDSVISAHTITKYLLITHTLTITLRFRSGAEKDSKIPWTEECKLTCEYCFTCNMM